MDRLHRVAARPLGQTERRLALVVEPVVEELDGESVLQLEVLDVRVGHVSSRYSGELVAIHVVRHADKDAAPFGSEATVRRRLGVRSVPRSRLMLHSRQHRGVLGKLG